MATPNSTPIYTTLTDLTPCRLRRLKLDIFVTALVAVGMIPIVDSYLAAPEPGSALHQGIGQLLYPATSPSKFVSIRRPIRPSWIPLWTMIPQFTGDAGASRASRIPAGHRFDQSGLAERWFIPRESGARTSPVMTSSPGIKYAARSRKSRGRRRDEADPGSCATPLVTLKRRHR